MSLHNIKTILRMVVDPKCLKLLRDVFGYFRGDPNFNVKKLITTCLGAIRGEKILRVSGGRYLVSSFLPPFPSRAFISMLLATRDEQKRFSQQMRWIRSAPISFYLAVTNRCNYNCAHCSAHGRSGGDELSTDEWKQVINDLQGMGTSIIGFTGGEPLLREDLEELVAAVDERSVTYVFTNGSSLSLERAKSLAKAGLFGMGISLDSVDPNVHDESRGCKGAWESALTAMENASVAGLHVMAQVVVPKWMLEPGNRGELYKLVRLAHGRGAAEVRLLEPICSGKLLGVSRAEDVFYSDQDRAAIIRFQEEVNQKPGYPKVTAFAHTESAERYGCGAGNQHSYITHDGQLLPCDFVPFSFGSVREKSVVELWQEMSEAIGIPKRECFALKLYSLLQEKADSLPLAREESEAICRREQSCDYPDFFKMMQK